MASAGNALVFSTFSCKTTGNSTTGTWQLSGSSGSSQAVQRYLSGSNDAGIASTVHIFTGLSAGTNTINLQQKSVTGKTLTTYDANMVIVPLVTSGGSALNYGLGQLTSATSTSSTSYVATNLTTSVTVDRDGGGIFFASSFNSLSGGTAVTGTWKMQYKDSSSGTWVDVGNVTERYMSGSNDTGAVTLYAMAEGVDSGTYDVRIVF
ncbi:MAG TPA: hypothetical protein PKK48_07995, partial [Phycisphaerae bacterium]|nr:hypothetical protein [Phycisphaerae bacterium]